MHQSRSRGSSSGCPVSHYLALLFLSGIQLQTWLFVPELVVVKPEPPELELEPVPAEDEPLVILANWLVVECCWLIGFAGCLGCSGANGRKKAHE
jgi:hypothetical protein